MKPMNIIMMPEDYKRINDLIDASGLKIQEFMTLKALEILQTEMSKNHKVHQETKRIQFRLDSTIHKLLKEKAKSLNKNVDELFFEILLK